MWQATAQGKTFPLKGRDSQKDQAHKDWPSVLTGWGLKAQHSYAMKQGSPWMLCIIY